MFTVAYVVTATLAVPTAPAGAQQESAVWQPGPGSIGDNSYVAYVEQPSLGMVSSGATFIISGWLVDTTAQGWAGFDQVQIYNGIMGAGGTLLASAEVGLDRPDVAAATGNTAWRASGFSASVNSNALQTGAYVLQLYGHTPDKGWWYTGFPLTVSMATDSPLAGPPMVSINRPRSDEAISANQTTYTINGAAVDPAATRATGVGIDRVEVYLNGPRDDPHGVFLGDATINGTDWSLTFSPHLYQWGGTSLFVYARSRLTGSESQAIQFLTIS
jgi:hypothetical protein